MQIEKTLINDRLKVAYVLTDPIVFFVYKQNFTAP